VIHITREPWRKVLSDFVYIVGYEKLKEKYILPKTFMHHYYKYKKLVKEFREITMFSNYIEFKTEEFIQPDSTMNPKVAEKVCDFLKIKRLPMKSDTDYVPKDHWSYIKNADEIKAEIVKEDNNVRFE
jgi:hypothetical protein